MVGATGLEPATPCTPLPKSDFPKLLKTHNYLISLNSYDNTKGRMEREKLAGRGLRVRNRPEMRNYHSAVNEDS
jgi:hypothetical protein